MSVEVLASSLCTCLHRYNIASSCNREAVDMGRKYDTFTLQVARMSQQITAVSSTLVLSVQVCQCWQQPVIERNVPRA